MSVNKVIILGRLGQDPDLKYTSGGSPVCNISLATSESWTDKQGQKQERTEWHRVVVYGKLAELCNQYLAKGRQAFVEGRLQTRSWDDKEGVKRYSTEIIASTVQFLGGSANAGAGAGQSSKDDKDAGGQPSAEYELASDASFAADDIPF